MEPYVVLVIARSQSLAKRLQRAVREECRVRWVSSTVQALGVDDQPALLIFDVPPGGGGRNLARLKRRFAVPILALLQPAGGGAPNPYPLSLADCVVERPFQLEQLAQLVHSTWLEHAVDIVRAPGMWLDTRSRQVQTRDALFQLTPICSQLLALLMVAAGSTIPRDELFRRVWNTDHGDNTRALDVHIAHLRRQLEEDPRHPRLILTERGLGYRLQPPGG